VTSRFKHMSRAILVGAFGLLLGACQSPPAGETATGSAAQPASAPQQTFATPEAAVQALGELIGQRDKAAVEHMFGPGAWDLFDSGDADEDTENITHVKAMIAEGVAFEEPDENTRIALLGRDQWPAPIPIVRAGDAWRFDTEAGREELLSRRIGRNELTTLDTLHEIVAAQKEYASAGRDGNAPAYARMFLSSDGKRDGLYWPPVDGEALSPLGDLLAESEYQKRAVAAESEGPRPYEGYFYRILTAQGAGAPGGARSYLDEKGLLSHGYAVIAWPAEYGSSGIMTFLINQQGIPFQKDLGADTATTAAAMETYDPDESWLPTADHLELVEE
jgi:hypothetical protein